jgi:L-alanine-DL-glutamate epimerase-like enolase superfamily enzyme
MLADVLFLVSNRIVDAISLKIPKLGGLRNTLLAAQAAHLAASFPKLDFACELAEFDHLLDDPFEGIEVRDGTLTVPESPGSGVRLIGRR